MAVSIPATMRALQQTSLRGPQDMRLTTDAPVPSPGRGEVLIRVAAAGVNFADLSRAYGTFMGGPQPPLAPTATGVVRVIEFHDPALVATFGFPDVLAD